MSFGENLKRIRVERRLSQKELGARVGKSHTTIARYENDSTNHNIDAAHIRKIESGKTHPTTRTIEKLANALDCSIAELFGEEPKAIDKNFGLNDIITVNGEQFIITGWDRGTSENGTSLKLYGRAIYVIEGR